MVLLQELQDDVVPVHLVRVAVSGQLPPRGMSVRLQRVVMPGSETVSWTVLADSGEPVAPIEAYLSFLCAIERSPNTVRHYAVGLKLFFEFLDDAGLAWREASVDDVARFVAWLRAPDPDVIGETLGRQPATVNQILAAVFGCYDYLARLGVSLSEVWSPGGGRGGAPTRRFYITPPKRTRSRSARCAWRCRAEQPRPSPSSRSWPSWLRASTCGTASCSR